MPAFSFEKISPPGMSPPSHRGPIPPTEQKQRGVIVQVLGRFVEARVQRAAQSEPPTSNRRDQSKPE